LKKRSVILDNDRVSISQRHRRTTVTQVLSFPLQRPSGIRRTPAVRILAALILILFSAAVLWTTIISAGGYCLTTGGQAPALGHGTAR